MWPEDGVGGYCLPGQGCEEPGLGKLGLDRRIPGYCSKRLFLWQD